MAKQEENPKLRALKVLIEKKDIKSFSQIFKKKHLPVSELARILSMAHASAKLRIDDPAHFTLGEIIKIAEAIPVDRELVLKIVWADMKAKNNF